MMRPIARVRTSPPVLRPPVLPDGPTRRPRPGGDPADEPLEQLAILGLVSSASAIPGIGDAAHERGRNQPGQARDTGRVPDAREVSR
jgi:hypothetical protein